jgi:HK97 gp10 family phage protein
MQVKVDFNDHHLIKQIQAMPEAVDKAVRMAVNKVTAEARREITGSEGLSKYGRHQAGTPTSSPPGEPPAQITTNLRRSIKISPARKIGFGKYSGYVEPTAIYAKAQELGTATMPARPFMHPARERMDRKATRIFRDALYVELKLKHG